MKINLLIATGLFCLCNNYGQTFEQSFSGYYYNQDFPGRNILITEDGAYVLAGKSLAINGLSSLALSMFYKDGTRLWANNYETGEYLDFRISVEASANNGFVVIASGSHLTRIIQTDRTGRRLWTKSINYGKYEDNGPFLLTTDSTGFLLCGTRELGEEENFRRIISLRMVDTSGNISNEKTISSDRHLTLHSMVKAIDGTFLITGHTGFIYPEGSNLFVARTDQEGDTIWAKEFTEITNLRNSSSCQLKNKQFIVTGTYRSEVSFQDRIFILWLDKDGNKVLFKTFTGEMSQAYSIIQTSDNGFAISGCTESLGNGRKDVMILKTDILGQTQWIVTFGGEYDDCGYEIRQTADSGYIVAGATESYGQDHSYMIKTDKMGRVVCRLDHSRFFSPQIRSVSTDYRAEKVMISYEPVPGNAKILLYKESALPGSFLLVNRKENNESGIIYDSTALPDVRSYKYLIRVINECQDTSLASTLHGTIFLEAFTGGNNTRNLIWNQYTGAEVQTYVILRSTLGDFFTELDFVPGMVTSYSDLNPPNGMVNYKVKALLQKEGSDFSNPQDTSCSNVVSFSEIISDWTRSDEPVSVYPNPVTSSVTIEFPGSGNKGYTVTVVDLSGKVIRSFKEIYGHSFVFQRTGIPPGFYIIQLKGPGIIYREGVVFE